jgi:quercetin dioxygenase-like cupin family protein
MINEIFQSGLLQKPTLENSIWYNGHTFSFLVDASQTKGQFSLIHCNFRKGGEPPAHLHQFEDETFYMLEGEIDFQIGDSTFTAKAGDSVYSPKTIPHRFTLVSPTAKALMLITPAAMESFFREFSVPAQSLSLPPIPDQKPSPEFFQKMMKRATEYGLKWMPEF